MSDYSKFLKTPAVPRESRIDQRRPFGPVISKPRDLPWPDTLPTPEIAALVQRDDFADFLARDDVVIPALEDREGYNSGLEYIYWLDGFVDYFCMNHHMGGLFKQNLSVLDFGGCTGRVARHFLTACPKSHVTIAEANINYVDWVNTYFGENCRGMKVGPSPEIPVEDNTFDFAFGISVFTHIDADELAWLRQLIRVVRPDGYIYLTILSEHSWATMDRETLLNIIKAEYECNQSIASAVGGPMPLDRFSITLEFNDTINNWNVFRSSAYINRVWGALATVKKIVFGSHGYQTAVILKNNKKIKGK